jgi:hypothetical protein
VSHVDGTELPMPSERMRTLADAYASVPWDEI